VAAALALALLVFFPSVGFTTVANLPRSSTLRSSARVAMNAGPALAPSPVRTAAPQTVLPARIEDERFGEKVRWLMDEEFQPPPAWHVLLLDGTFRRPQNTVPRVASVLTSSLGLASPLAMGKAEFARDNYFAVVHTTPDFKEAVSQAQSLQKRDLRVRVVPGDSMQGGALDGQHSQDRSNVGASMRGVNPQSYASR